jgi:GNAT superfamily N-acetyltransferase
MVTDLELRLATLDDVSALVRHRRQMFVEMDGLKGIQYDPAGLDVMDAVYAVFARDSLNSGRMQAWVIADGARIAASGALLYTNWLPRPDGVKPVLAYVHSVYTEADYRRSGLARRILKAMLEEGRARGLGRISLHASNQGRGLYEELGFVPTNEMRLILV